MISKEISVTRYEEKSFTHIFKKNITEFELQFNCKLPHVFTTFLREYSCSHMNGEIDLLELSPLGKTVNIDNTFGFCNDRYSADDIRENTEISNEFPELIPFADDLFGNWFYLYLGDKNNESKVLFFDRQNRFYWEDKEFHNMFENLSPTIIDYLEKRGKQQLKKKEKRFDNFYLIANTFEEFIQKIRPTNNDDE